MKFKYPDYFFIGLLAFVFIGFWPSYFSKFFDGTADFTHYFHFHAATATLWVGMLIAQPILIRRKQFQLHRTIGKASYLLVPILYISVILLAHHRIDPNLSNFPFEVWIPYKDLVIFTFGYGLAIYYRKTLAIHARGMIVAGMALVEPTMVRIFFNVLDIEPTAGYLMAISTVYITLIVLIILERNESKGRWVFPAAFGLFLFIHSVLLLEIKLPFWEDFARWFLALPLT